MLIEASTTAQQCFVDLSTRICGGGLNCEAKAQVLVVTPPSLFFLEVGRKTGGGGGGGVTVGQYGICMYMYVCNV